MADYDEPIGDLEKVKIATNFLIHAPPGEFSEVFNDVRLLLNNDQLLKESASSACAKYNTDQFIPTEVEDDNAKHSVLITTHGELDHGRVFDPRSKKSFRYDHLRNAASEVRDHVTCEGESFRSAVDKEFAKYIHNHYPHGIYAVYSKVVDGATTVTLCIEDHKFEPNNFWNGRWRSEWCATIDGDHAQVVGILKNQVHYYEDGNVQLVSQKECKDSVPVNSESQFAVEFLKLVKKAEGDYQEAISENYTNMSETTFKALRRQLPVTRAKLDWNKILGYKIGKEIGK